VSEAGVGSYWEWERWADWRGSLLSFMANMQATENAWMDATVLSMCMQLLDLKSLAVSRVSCYCC